MQNSDHPDDEQQPGLPWGAKRYKHLSEEDKPELVQQRNRETDADILEHISAFVAAAPLLPFETLQHVQALLASALEAARRREAREVMYLDERQEPRRGGLPRWQTRSVDSPSTPPARPRRRKSPDP